MCTCSVLQILNVYLKKILQILILHIYKIQGYLSVFKEYTFMTTDCVPNYVLYTYTMHYVLNRLVYEV